MKKIASLFLLIVLFAACEDKSDIDQYGVTLSLATANIKSAEIGLVEKGKQIAFTTLRPGENVKLNLRTNAKEKSGGYFVKLTTPTDQVFTKTFGSFEKYVDQSATKSYVIAFENKEVVVK